jgi:hypothetical protein
MLLTLARVVVALAALAVALGAVRSALRTIVVPRGSLDRVFPHRHPPSGGTPPAGVGPRSGG